MARSAPFVLLPFKTLSFYQAQIVPNIASTLSLPFCSSSRSSSSILQTRGRTGQDIFCSQHLRTQSRRWYEVLPASRHEKNNAARHKQSKKKSAKPSYRLVDRTRIRVTGGRGGNGSLSNFNISRRHRRRPDGGHGGAGGCVILVADPNEQSLKWSHPHVRAEDGAHGGSQEKTGRNGKNLILRVPCGVIVNRVLNFGETWDNEQSIMRKSCPTDSDNDNATENSDSDSDLESFDSGDDSETHDSDEEDNVQNHEERETVFLADLDKPGSHAVIARGGRGGIGSCYYVSDNRPLPDAETLSANAQPKDGEVVFLELILKMIADVGLVGFPNAGKSSLLRAMSRATPEVAPYPFTTLHPMIGCIDYQDGVQIKVADIPGLVAGASEGRGRGHAFLRHVERTKALIYIVDVAGVDFRDPITDLQVLVNELESYGDGSLLYRRALVVANKVDLLQEEKVSEKLYAIQKTAAELGILFENDVFGVSAGVTGIGLQNLAKSIREVVKKAEDDRNLLEFESMEHTYVR